MRSHCGGHWVRAPCTTFALGGVSVMSMGGNRGDDDDDDDDDDDAWGRGAGHCSSGGVAIHSGCCATASSPPSVASSSPSSAGSAVAWPAAYHFSRRPRASAVMPGVSRANAATMGSLSRAAPEDMARSS